MVIFFPAAVLYLFWEKLLRKIRWRDGIVAAVLMGIMLAPFVGTRFLFSGSSAGGYVIYQLFRSPNHPIWYFPVVFWIFITPLAVLAVVGGIVLACVRRDACRQAAGLVGRGVRAVLPVLADEAVARTRSS